MSQRALASAEIARLLDQKRADYQARLPEQLSQLEQLADDLIQSKTPGTILEELHQRLHKLTGAGGTFGFKKLSAAAQSLELQVKDWLAASADALDPARAGS